MNDAAVTTGLQSDIGRSTLEAVKLAHRFGFGQRQSQMSLESQTPNKSQTIDSLNSGASFCWCDPD